MFFPCLISFCTPVSLLLLKFFLLFFFSQWVISCHPTLAPAFSSVTTTSNVINLLFGLFVSRLAAASSASFYQCVHYPSFFMCLNHFSLASLSLSLRCLTLGCSADVLISNIIHPCHSQRKPQHLHLCQLHHLWSVDCLTKYRHFCAT